MPNIFDEKGLITQGFDDYRLEMSKVAKVAFSDKLNGKELRVDDSSMLGRIFAIASKGLVQNAEVLPLILQAMDINSAEGQQLDNLLWNIHRIKRKDSSQSTGLVVLYGDIGVVVSSGSSVSNSLTGDVYQTDNEVVFSNINAVGIDVAINSLGSRYSVSYTIDGCLSESPEIVVESGSSDTSYRAIADRLVDAVNSQSSYLIASRNNDNSVKILLKEKFRVANFLVSDTLTVPRSHMPVYVTSSTYDSRESIPEQITSIRTSTLGWRGVTNPYYILPSTSVEDDENYRLRGKILQQSTNSKYNAIIMALKSVRGVVYENVQQNTSANTTNSGIINNGLAITVMGGNEDAVALAIFNSISAGIMTVGNIVKTVKDVNGVGHDIRFSRPETKQLEIKMSLVTYPDFPTNGNAIIKQAIVEWFNSLNVGEDIHYSRLYEPINTIKGFAVKSLRFGYKGGTLGMEDVVINSNGIATISAEDINIGGN